MSKNTQIGELINYISVNESGNVVLSNGHLVATQNYVSTAVANLVDAAPATLDTLNELAAALGDDPNFATTLTTSIGGKLSLTGGTLSGALNGTSAVFSSTVSATQYTATSTGGSGLRVYGAAGTNQWDIYLNSTNLRFSDNTGTGNIVFDRPLNASTINAGQSLFQVSDAGVGTKTLVQTLERTSASPSSTAREVGLAFKDGNNSTLVGGVAGVRFNSSGNYYGGLKFYVMGASGTPATTFSDLTAALTIDYASAATFSSSVTANQFISNATNVGDEYYFFKGNAVVNNNFSIYAYTNFLYINAYSSINIRANNTGGSGGTINLTGGNVGIGTGSPTNRLEVKGLFGAPTTTGNAQNGIARFSQTSGGGSLDIGFGDPYSWIQSRQSADYSTNYALALNPNGGNVLIGTTTDNGAKLNVGGSYQAYPVSIEAMAGGGQLALTRSGAVAEFYMGGSTGGGTQLYVRSGGSGGVRLDAGSTGWVSASDIRLKDVTKPIQKAVESLSGLQTIYYSWKDSIDKSLHIGLIAQEVEKVFPELVSESSIDGMKGVNYTELIPVIIKAIQELNEKINK